jgi:hypothetical protein
MYNTNDFGNKTLKIVLVYLLEVIVVNLALNVLVAFSGYVFLKIFLSSSV